MNWYIAKLVFRIVCGEGQHTPQFDEQLWLVAAQSRQEALNKARGNGNREEESLQENSTNMVKWQFIDVAELHEIKGLEDGIELYSRVEETENASQYIDYIKLKAQATMETAIHTSIPGFA